jgi:hypothetical protein
MAALKQAMPGTHVMPTGRLMLAVLVLRLLVEMDTFSIEPPSG